MNKKILGKVINTTLTILGISSPAYAHHVDDSNLLVTLGVPTVDADENPEAMAQLQKVLSKSGAKDYTINFDPSGLLAKVVVKKSENNQNLESLIKKLNSQLKNKVVIVEVAPAKITNGTQDDL
ncbi:MAG: hypothetical protein V4654_09685 [Bdellovibrionota bacterium]